MENRILNALKEAGKPVRPVMWPNCLGKTAKMCQKLSVS